jgi:Tol biopolymer transport system component
MGMILGTAAYMAPEQAKGKPVDKRADIWAFGCVLFEMLTGQRAFGGEDVTDTLAAVVRTEPEWDALPDGVSPSVRMFLRRCLQKNAKQRLHDIADMRLALEGAFEAALSQTATPVAHLPTWLRVAILTIGTVVIGAVVAAIAVVGWRNTADAAKVSFEVQANSAGVAGASMVALSPDGRNLVAQVVDNEGVNRLWIRPIDHVTGVTPHGTEGATYPFWSPDGRYIGFFADGKLKKVDILGAPPDSLSDATAGRGGTWNRDGVILFAPEASGPLFRIAASGGQPVQVTDLDKTRSETAHRFPRFLPDGVHFLYLAVSSQADETGIVVGSLNSKDTKRLVASSVNAEFAAPDLLLFLRDSTLMAQRFDTNRLELFGDPFQVAEQVGSGSVVGVAGFTASVNGVLAYRTGTGGARTLVWIDRSGKVEGSIGTPARYENPRLSPDGKRLAVFKPEGGGDIWITDLERGSSTRFTFDPATDQDPVWSPDGAQLAFVSNRTGGVFNLYRKSAGGAGNDELLLKTPNNKWIDDWSADGRFIAYYEEDPSTKADLWVLPLFGDRKPMRLLGTAFNERYASFSPDGRWIAYTSDEGGRLHVYVQAFPSSDRKWQVSTTPTRNNAYPRWRPDGKELFYDSGGTMTAVELIGTQPGGEFKAGTPQELFRGLRGGLPPHNYDVTPGGRRFLIVSGQDLEAGPPLIVVVMNWTSGLKR